MTDYQRIVSYLYEYNNGMKGSNVGFARIERRQNQLKVYFHVKTNDQSLSYKIYFYRFHEGAMEGTLLDTFSRPDVVVEMKQTYPFVVNLDEVDGILIYHSPQLFFGSEWNDKPIAIRNFLPLELQESKEIKEPEDIQESENIQEPESVPPSDDAAPNVTSKLVEYIEALQLEKDAKESNSDFVPKDFDWKEYPSLSLSANSLFDPCVKISLDDVSSIKAIPSTFAKNGFLLLNYGNYGHLMLGFHKVHQTLYIGVPGTFDNEKNFIAKFFGFNNFITIPEKQCKTGNFGYWVTSI